MILSVSMFASSSGAATAVTLVNGCISCSLHQLAHVGQLARNRCRRDHRRTHQMRARALALAALEVAVRRRGAALAGRYRVAVHRCAARAARRAPVETRRDKNLVEPLGFGLALDRAR